MPVSSPGMAPRGMRISGNNIILSMVSRFLICDLIGLGSLNSRAGFFAGTNTSWSNGTFDGRRQLTLPEICPRFAHRSKERWPILKVGGEDLLHHHPRKLRDKVV